MKKTMKWRTKKPMKKMIKVLIVIFVALIAVKLYLYYQSEIYYTKPFFRVNFTEPKIGEIKVPMKKTTKQILFDEGHQNIHSIYSDYSSLASIFGEAGFEIKTSEEEIESLEGIDVLVLVAPTAGYSKDEIDHITHAVEDGMTLITIGEKESSDILNEISLNFGITFNNDYIYDLQNYTLHFKNPIISYFLNSGLTEKLRLIAIYEGCSLNAFKPAYVIAFAFPPAKSSSGIYATEFNVMAISDLASSRIFAICDSDIFSNKFIKNFDNEALARNLVNWSLS